MSDLSIDSMMRRVEHRPWPVPPRSWFCVQSWQHLLFAHWPVPVAMLRPLVPQPLEIDTFDGTAWVAVVPFLLADMRVRFMPPIAGLHEFLETNVRTYVTHEGRVGVYFFSLDAASRLAVFAARTSFGLPYENASMSIAHDGETIEHRSTRHRGDAAWVSRHRPRGVPFVPRPGSLEHFLVERYALLVVRRGKVMRGDIHHAPWTLQVAEAQIERNTLAQAAGITVAGAPLLHHSARQDTQIWLPVENDGTKAHARPART